MHVTFAERAANAADAQGKNFAVVFNRKESAEVISFKAEVESLTKTSFSAGDNSAVMFFPNNVVLYSTALQSLAGVAYVQQTLAFDKVVESGIEYLWVRVFDDISRVQYTFQMDGTPHNSTVPHEISAIVKFYLNNR